jgi:hypothetical protein
MIKYMTNTEYITKLNNTGIFFLSQITGEGPRFPTNAFSFAILIHQEVVHEVTGRHNVETIVSLI